MNPIDTVVKFFQKGPVVRVAPSPTGNLHVGLARVALFNYLFAKRHGGKFLLRIEDTDRERSKREFEKDILDSLAWLGLGHEGFCRQSDRTDIYRNHLTRLLETDKAYLSREPKKDDPGILVEVVRLRNRGGNIEFTDMIRGDISLDTTELGDFVIARNINDPLYHLAVVVDDFEAGITHVIRGEDHISNTPRQILIQEALGFPRPLYAHLPLLLAPDRSKLSKRHGAVSLSEYRNEGFLPEALLNYLAFLGWNPGDNREILSLHELGELFSLEQVQKGGAIFDMEKLRWYNREYLKRSPSSLIEAIEVFLPEEVRSAEGYTQERLTRVIPTLLERIATLREVSILGKEGELSYVFSEPSYPTEKLYWKDERDPVKTHERLLAVRSLLENLSEQSFSAEETKEVLWGYAEKEGKGSVLWPLRVALSGKDKSPDPFTLAGILGKKETLIRIDSALQKLSSCTPNTSRS